MALTESSAVVGDFGAVLEKAFNPYDDKQLRVPFYLTSTYRKRLGVRGVSMLVNPSNISFKQNKRITRKDTQGGAVIFHWSNKMGRDNDILEMDFSGSTGNINIRTGGVRGGALSLFGGQATEHGPISWLNNAANATTKAEDDFSPTVKLQGNDYSVSGAAKLNSFWNLYSLTREPVVDPKTGAPVLYYITYSSPALGNSTVTFIGNFSRVLDWNDDATNPYAKNYTFGFTVLASMPSMDYLYTTITQNLRSIFLNPL